MDKDYSCYMISNRPQFLSAVQESIAPEKVALFNGEGYDSFSKLVNSCVANCPTEIVIMMSDKVRPKKEHVDKVITLLNEGYGFVALYRFAFFGFKKELFRRIGPFDQRFMGGGGEDDDFCIRLNEANIACYITEEVEYLPSSTTWGGYSFGIEMLAKKWNYTYKKQGWLKRQYPEEDWKYNFGPQIPEKFLTYDKRFIDASRVGRWSKKVILGINDNLPEK